MISLQGSRVRRTLDQRVFIRGGTSTPQFLYRGGSLSSVRMAKLTVADGTPDYSMTSEKSKKDPMNDLTPEEPINAFTRIAVKEVHETISRLLDVKQCVTLFITPGHTMKGFLHYFAQTELDWQRILVFNVVELDGLSGREDSSFSQYLPSMFFSHFPKERPFPMKNYISFRGDEHCAAAFDEIISGFRSFDVGILGVGRIGDIGLIMPGTNWGSRMGKIELPPSVVEGKGLVFKGDRGLPGLPAPCLAWTIGMKRIFETQRLFLLAFGEEKREIVDRALHGPTTTKVPASILQIHPNVHVILDHEAAGMRLGVEHSPRQAFGMLTATGLCPEEVGLDIRQPFEAVVYDHFNLVSEPVLMTFLKRFARPLAQCSPQELEASLEADILQYYLDNIYKLAATLPEENDLAEAEAAKLPEEDIFAKEEAAKERLADIFRRSIRVCKFPHIRSKEKNIKWLLMHYIFGNIRKVVARKEAVSRYGSQDRSEVCKKVLLNDILLSNDQWFLQTSVEAIVEFLALGEKSGEFEASENRFLGWFSSIASPTGRVFDLSRFLAKTLFKARDGSLVLAEAKDKLELYRKAVQVVAKFILMDHAMTVKFLGYVSSKSQDPAFTGAANEIIEAVMRLSTDLQPRLPQGNADGK